MRSPSAARRLACSTRSTSRACARSTTTSRRRSSGCSPAWRWSASASTRSTCASCTTPSSARCDELQQQIWDDAGEEFVVNSTPQLRTILYEKLGLTPQKRTKTGFSTDAQTLQKLEGQHPIIEHLLSYREVEKLRSTYGEGLLAEVRDDGRIHATFNQTVARTGRLSSDAPNLHNIPVRSDLGRTFRAAFVPAKGCKLLVADYNQIELRCIAHLAEDPGLVAAFNAGEDIHTATAPGCSRSSPATSRRRSGPSRRWSATASPTAWSPSGSRSDSTSRWRRRPGSSRRTSRPSRR